MGVIIDLIIIGVILLFVIIGYVKGLTGSLIKIVSFALSLVVAFVLFVPVSNFVINNTQIDDNLEKTIRNIVISEEAGNETEKVPEAISDYINQRVDQAVDQAKQGVVNSIATDVTHTIIKAGTWIVLFLVARILLILLKFITAFITKLPVIKQFDKVGGIVYGLLEGLVITYLALAIISFVAPMTKGNLSKNINDSYVGSYMYNNNLLLKIIF